MFKHIKNYSHKNIYPFHMPGHKQNKSFFKGFDFLKYDLTEFNSMDNLHHSDGIILKSEKKASKFFGAHKSFYLTNGTTSGVLIAMSSVLSKNSKVIVARNSHMSVYNAINILELKPVYVYPSIINFGLLGGINPYDIEQAIINNKDAQAIILTSPTYEGVVSDIETISKITSKYNKYLIIDEAHGANFCLSNIFPKSAVNYADIVVQSLHKTLPTLGQSAILHINNKIDDNKIKFYRAVFNTSSPSYLMMSSMDYAIDKLMLSSNITTNYLNMLHEFRKKVSNNKLFTLLDKKVGSKYNIHDIDISKLTFIINNQKLTGNILDNVLSKKYKIQIELSGLNHFMALSTVCDIKSGFNRLYKALNELESNIKPRKLNYSDINIEKLHIALKISETLNLEGEYMLLENSINRISKEFVIVYPPGIPIIAPGELISGNIINKIKIYKKVGASFVGCVYNDLSKILVVLKN